MTAGYLVNITEIQAIMLLSMPSAVFAELYIVKIDLFDHILSHYMRRIDSQYLLQKTLTICQYLTIFY